MWVHIQDGIFPGEPNIFPGKSEACANRVCAVSPCRIPHGEKKEKTLSTTGWSIWSQALVGLTLFLAVPLSAWFCWGRWELGSVGIAAGQSGGPVKIIVNPTKVSDQMPLTVEHACWIGVLSNLNFTQPLILTRDSPSGCRGGRGTLPDAAAADAVIDCPGRGGREEIEWAAAAESERRTVGWEQRFFCARERSRPTSPHPLRSMGAENKTTILNQIHTVWFIREIW